MPLHSLTRQELSEKSRDFYHQLHVVLKKAEIPFLVGGAFALEYYTGVWRYTKDLDIFVRSQDCPRVLQAAAASGFQSEVIFTHWLGKIFHENDFVDVIFSSGNGVAKVDDSWFAHAVRGQILGLDTDVCPVEEMIWSKAFVMERERFDGADIAHLLHACAESLDWDRLSHRFGKHWRILFAHLTLFGFIYPSERRRIPEALMRECLRLLDYEM